MMFDPAALRAAVLAKLQAEPPQTQATSAPAPSGIGPYPYVADAAGDLADGLSTYAALKTGHASEGNPLLPNSGAGVLAIKAASILPEALAMRWLAGHGHPTIAKVLGYGLGAAGGAAAVHNVGVARR
jgi:hypothetical protein